MRNGLTKREYEVLEMYIETGSQRETAERLFLALPTVKNHLTSARNRVGARNTMQLVYQLATGDLDRD